MKTFVSSSGAFVPPVCGALLLLSLATRPVIAQSATWLASPGSGDWNTPANWTGGTVPQISPDVATFATSAITAVSLSSDTEVNGIVFSPGASAFSITAPALRLKFFSTGITNSSGITQNFVTLRGGVPFDDIAFYNNASAGSLTRFTNTGGTVGGGGVDSLGGLTSFHETSSAGSGTFINNAGTVSGAYGGYTRFGDTATAANGIFVSEGSSISGAYGGITEFNTSATAANGTFTNNGTTVTGGHGGITDFSHDTTAANGTFTINGASAPGTGSGDGGGQARFSINATAASGTFTANGGTVAGADGALLFFFDNTTAGNSTLIINGGTNGGDGAALIFQGDSTGGTAAVSVFGNGQVRVQASTVSIGSLTGTGSVNLDANPLSVGGSNLSTAFTGVLEGTGGSLTKIGSGTLTLSGANTYTGGTTVSAGTLLVNNASGSGVGTGGLAVQDGATLGGSGSIDGSTTIAGGGHLAPGNSPGTLTFTNGLTLLTGSILDFQLGTDSDLIAVTGGTLTGASGLILNLSDAGGFAPGVSYTLFSFVSGQTSNFNTADFSFGTLVAGTVGSEYSLTLTDTSLALTYNGSISPVPEPSTYAAILASAALGFAAWRRRHAPALTAPPAARNA